MTTASQQTKYVAAITTNANGIVLATVQSISTLVNGSVISLAPLEDSVTPKTFTAGSSAGLYGWRCGSTTDGTSNNIGKYLPGSCRG